MTPDTEIRKCRPLYPPWATSRSKVPRKQQQLRLVRWSLPSLLPHVLHTTGCWMVAHHRLSQKNQDCASTDRQDKQSRRRHSSVRTLGRLRHLSWCTEAMPVEADEELYILPIARGQHWRRPGLSTKKSNIPDATGAFKITPLDKYQHFYDCLHQ